MIRAPCRARRCWFLAAGLIALVASPASPTRAQPTFDVQQVSNGVLLIRSQAVVVDASSRADVPVVNGIWHGTGFVIDDDGDIATNYHVVRPLDSDEGRALVKRAPSAEIRLSVYEDAANPDRRLPAKIKWESADRDLAIIHVDGLVRPKLTLSLFPVQQGEHMFAFGFPGLANLPTPGSEPSPSSLVPTLSEGEVGRVLKGSWTAGPITFPVVQHHALINPGNSGGPLLNACGEVVGVNTKKSKGEERDAYAYASHISSLIEGLKNAASPPPIAVAGHRCRVTAGVALGWSDPSRWGVFGALLLAATATVLALRRPRQVVRVIERVSRPVREALSPRPQRVAPPIAPAPRPLAAVQMAAVPVRRRGGWVVWGFDPAGRVVRFAIDRATLEERRRGMIIGRDSRIADFVIGETSVSRCHAVVRLDDGKLVLEDLDSTQGTKVGDQPVAPFTAVELSDGAWLSFGEVRLQLRIEAPA